MAEKTLRLVFQDEMNEKRNVTISVHQSDDTIGAGIIKSAMNVIYANKGIFSLDIGTPKAAAFVTPLSLAYVDISE